MLIYGFSAPKFPLSACMSLFLFSGVNPKITCQLLTLILKTVNILAVGTKSHIPLTHYALQKESLMFVE